MSIVPILAVSDLIWTGLISAIAAPVAALFIGQQLNRQRRTEKSEDYARQDEVAKRAESARLELAASNQAVADEAARQQAQVAAVAAGAAELLRDAQAATRSDADEVARLAAGVGEAPTAPTGRARTLAVVISHPSGVQRVIELDAIPREGDHILLRDSASSGSQPQRVANVLWVEANGGNKPSVVVVVCPAKPGTDLLSDAVVGARLHEDT